MKKWTLLLASAFALSIVTFTPGCDPKEDEDDGPPCNLTNADLGYNKNIKKIIDDNCISCHSGTGPGPGDYRTYSGLKSNIDDGDLLDRVVVKKDMPTSGLTITQAQRDSINCWLDAGAPQ